MLFFNHIREQIVKIKKWTLKKLEYFVSNFLNSIHLVFLKEKIQNNQELLIIEKKQPQVVDEKTRPDQVVKILNIKQVEQRNASILSVLFLIL